MTQTLTHIQPMRNRERLRVSPDVANLMRRVQSLRPGEYVLTFSVDVDGRLTWRYAELSKPENNR